MHLHHSSRFALPPGLYRDKSKACYQIALPLMAAWLAGYQRADRLPAALDRHSLASDDNIASIWHVTLLMQAVTRVCTNNSGRQHSPSGADGRSKGVKAVN
uniref:Uncharacterized protein n=1 Tax=Erwinia amylovora ATCC BAA-2158 TaxID=889211 RepID=E5B8G1_ERWAM|nr:hypothetical protein predicted by Glimmer/Critica [Erwinia amylovora ATCC BAA-2158]